ncbi:MAG TPA: tRNA (adenosine(37)-N6)-threonylcarbamoyltransferase complex ATPase subunit type 1 TsaE [Chitinophagaceae bacterium]|nr:tRNA (adenosine(37)-N6)-threonylcarbamoyltransferase complex ATPase subunit type 1 TsaE [Chitinophagaceae bacterium]
MELVFSLDEIESVAKSFLNYMDNKKVIAFHGNLGAGKTTFIKALGEHLGVGENISSPTFSIINQYAAADNKNIFHIDLYRVKDTEEAINAGVEECIYSGDSCFIEWPEKVLSILPEDIVNVYMEPISETKRKIICKLPSL